MVSLVVFDLDGTLVDTLDDIGSALNLTLASYNVPAMTRADIMAGVGDGVDDLLRAAIGTNPIVLTEFRERHRQNYRKNINAHGKLYDGVHDVLQFLSDQPIPVAILTNKPELPAKRLIQLFEIERHFKIIAGPDTYGVHKPRPEGLQAIMKELNVAPEKTVMIGDGDTDVMTGKDAGTRTISVTYGYRSAEVLAALNPDALADSMSMVQSVLAEWISQ
jgi:phosphoglycolate phosphatase